MSVSDWDLDSHSWSEGFIYFYIHTSEERSVWEKDKKEEQDLLWWQAFKWQNQNVNQHDVMLLPNTAWRDVTAQDGSTRRPETSCFKEFLSHDWLF